MEDFSCVSDGELCQIKFGLATSQEICKGSNSDFPITHASQLKNPFLGLPLNSGKCATCGTSEAGQCDGHFGFVDLPVAIYHPSHVSELRRLLNLLCLRCLRLKKSKLFMAKHSFISSELNAASSCCKESSEVTVNEVKSSDGTVSLEMKQPSRNARNGLWDFMKKYGFKYGESQTRPLLPLEVLYMLKKMHADTEKKLAAKGFFSQEGYILRYLPIPPNCLSAPDISDANFVISSDISITLLKKIMRQVEIIRCSRSGEPNFEAHEVESHDLQLAVMQYFQMRGASKTSHDVVGRFGTGGESSNLPTKAWLEKMRALFIRKGSGFCSRSVITGDAFKRVDEIGIPYEIAQRITFEERVTVHNIKFLQSMVDQKLCVTYKDGMSTFSLREGSKGHTFLRVSQVVHRRIMDGDIVFMNRPPTTHKHSLQAFSVYIHDGNTVKINPLICGPLNADFDGDCVHLFYPQSLAAKAETVELFSVGKQIMSSHNGTVNLQITADSLLSLTRLLHVSTLKKVEVQQLIMHVSGSLPPFENRSLSFWKSLQLIKCCFPAHINSRKVKTLIEKNKVFESGQTRGPVLSFFNDIISMIIARQGPEEVLRVFNDLQPLLMEFLFSEGYSLDLRNFILPCHEKIKIQEGVCGLLPLLFSLRTLYSETVELKLNTQVKKLSLGVAEFVGKSFQLSGLVDVKSESAASRAVQQLGFLGMQLPDRRNAYSRTLVDGMRRLFRPFHDLGGTGSAEYGFVSACFCSGLNPYEELLHAVGTREVMVSSSRGLSEPGTLFKNLMAILRDIVVCYDRTVRNICSGFVIQFEYGPDTGSKQHTFVPAGEPVGVLAATAMSNPAYKAVLDSSSSSCSSWAMMKEILLSKVVFRNDDADRRVLLYLRHCDCRRHCCQERAAYVVQNFLKKVCLADAAVAFFIRHEKQQIPCEFDHGLVGHIHLNEALLDQMWLSVSEILHKCEQTIRFHQKKKKQLGMIFRKVSLLLCEDCCYASRESSSSAAIPTGNLCLKFYMQDKVEGMFEPLHFELCLRVLSDVVCPALLDTVINGDSRVLSIRMVSFEPCPGGRTDERGTCRNRRLGLDVVLEKSAVKKRGDSWRIMMDACLPVMHLIDTEMSRPCAIKEMEHELGISCAFDQAVQRLERSVSMVAKGILNEHLLLLASTMCCSGDLIGFNVGGYKTLSRLLNIQVPFTDATLFTPKRCFERAAEMQHVDSVAGVVASCSWGKRVAVGTGSSFDLLWNDELGGYGRDDDDDVYAFLGMHETVDCEASTSCLGVEIDSLNAPDHDRSPEREGNQKPAFDDIIMVEDDEGSWEGANERVAVEARGLDTAVSEPWEGGWNEVRRPESAAAIFDASNGGGWDAPTNDFSRGGENNECVEAASEQQWEGGNEAVWNDPVSAAVDDESWGAVTTRSSACMDGDTEGSWGGARNASDGETRPVASAADDDSWGGRKAVNRWECDDEYGGGGAEQQPEWGGGQTKFWPLTSDSPRDSQRRERSRPPRAPMTASRLRLDAFTAEEQDVVTVIDPIVLSVRKIMQRTGDGEALSAEDQAFVVREVLEFHPMKGAKVGSGIEYIKMERHEMFGESRCFHLVRKDGGGVEDFSYIKCLENLVHTTYPSHLADSFNAKYFTEMRSRTQPSACS